MNKFISKIKSNNPQYNWMSCVQEVFPTDAKYILENKGNPDNRKFTQSDPRVQSHVVEMRRGNWQASPAAPLCFDEDGMLINGHHRLTAVALSGVPCKFVVFRDVPYDHVKFIDTNKGRTNRQIAVMFGEDSRFDAAFKVISMIRCGGQIKEFLGPSNLERYRSEFSVVDSDMRSALLGMRFSVRGSKGESKSVPLRAGIVAVLLLLLKDFPEPAGNFVIDLLGMTKREILGHKASRNLANWVEAYTGVHDRLALESAAAVYMAFGQFVRNEEKEFIRPVVKSLIEAYANKP